MSVLLFFVECSAIAGECSADALGPWNGCGSRVCVYVQKCPVDVSLQTKIFKSRIMLQIVWSKTLANFHFWYKWHNARVGDCMMWVVTLKVFSLFQIIYQSHATLIVPRKGYIRLKKSHGMRLSVSLLGIFLTTTFCDIPFQGVGVTYGLFNRWKCGLNNGSLIQTSFADQVSSLFVWLYVI